MCSLFFFFLVVVFEVGGSCFIVDLKCSQFKILCKFQVYSNVICLYLCICVCVCMCMYVCMCVCVYIYIYIHSEGDQP